MAVRKRHLGVLTFVIVVALVAVGGVIYVIRSIQWPFGTTAPECKASNASGSTTLTAEQADNASIIAAVGISKGLPERAVQIAVATAMQESKLRNLSYGDRDSYGLFQQRPSMGWGTQDQITDPVYAAGAFYDALVKVPSYQTMSLTQAAQAVQRSGYPEAYAQHETDAAVLSDAFMGVSPASLTCKPTDTPQQLGSAEVATTLKTEFGKAASASGVVKDNGDGTLTLKPSASVANGQGAGAMAEWAMAHATSLGIKQVEYGGKVWSLDKAGDGWRTDSSSADPSVVVLTVYPAVGASPSA